MDTNLPPTPPGDAPPYPEAEPQRPIWKRWWFWLAVLVGFGVIALITVVAGVGSEDGFPDEIAGLDRLHTDSVEGLEHATDKVNVDGGSVRVAVYGTGAELMVYRFSDFPSPPTLSSVLRRNGTVVSGGPIDLDSEVVQTRDGVEYHCVAFAGRPFPPIHMAEVNGHSCVWAEGDEYLLLVDARAPNYLLATTDAHAAHEALA